MQKNYLTTQVVILYKIDPTLNNETSDVSNYNYIDVFKNSSFKHTT